MKMQHAVLPLLILLSACMPDFLTDAATRIAYDVERRVGGLASAEGARLTLDGLTPRATGECEGAFKAQFDKVGALIVWCYDTAGKVVSSGSTSYIARFIDTPQTWIVDKKPGEAVKMVLERRGGRAVVTELR